MQLQARRGENGAVSNAACRTDKNSSSRSTSRSAKKQLAGFTTESVGGIVLLMC